MPKQRKYALAFLFTISICVLAWYIHRHRQGKTGAIDNFLISSSASLQKSFFYFSKGSRTIVDRYILLVNVEKERDDLKVQLRAKLNERDTVQAQYDGFRKNMKELMGQADAAAATLNYKPGSEVASIAPQAP